jgi:hypothetical protein
LSRGFVGKESEVRMKLGRLKLNKKDIRNKFEDLMKKIFENNQNKVDKERSFIKSYLHHGSCKDPFHY